MYPVFMRSTASNHYDKIRLTIIQKSEGDVDSTSACAPDKMTIQPVMSFEMNSSVYLSSKRKVLWLWGIISSSCFAC
jgi:hypothetical protein